MRLGDAKYSVIDVIPTGAQWKTAYVLGCCLQDFEARVLRAIEYDLNGK